MRPAIGSGLRVEGFGFGVRVRRADARIGFLGLSLTVLRAIWRCPGAFLVVSCDPPLLDGPAREPEFFGACFGDFCRSFPCAAPWSPPRALAHNILGAIFATYDASFPPLSSAARWFPSHCLLPVRSPGAHASGASGACSASGTVQVVLDDQDDTPL